MIHFLFSPLPSPPPIQQWLSGCRQWFLVPPVEDPPPPYFVDQFWNSTINIRLSTNQVLLRPWTRSSSLQLRQPGRAQPGQPHSLTSLTYHRLRLDHRTGNHKWWEDAGIVYSSDSQSVRATLSLYRDDWSSWDCWEVSNVCFVTAGGGWSLCLNNKYLRNIYIIYTHTSH